MGADTDKPDRLASGETLASVHSAGFPELLRQLGISLLVSTYQAGKLVVLRADGDSVNTHFLDFNTPMGVAADANRIALGTRSEIVEFHNMPAVATRLHDPPRHDAVYLARAGHITGAIDIHEMAWDAQGELWFVNTLFSTLCTRDASHSFVPRWRPAFVSGLAAEDRCHLNGLGMRDGQPRYVTALAQTNTAQGWRDHKHDGGVLIDCANDETLVRGLAMPHSPRWHDGRLWLLESGRGALCCVDEQSRQQREVARLPGFVRGMDLIGKVACRNCATSIRLAKSTANANAACGPCIWKAAASSACSSSPARYRRFLLYRRSVACSSRKSSTTDHCWIPAMPCPMRHWAMWRTEANRNPVRSTPCLENGSRLPPG